MNNTRRLVAIRDVSLHVDAGEIVGIVGESGCGKSQTAYSVLQIVPEPGKITGGEIYFCGENLLGKTEAELRSVRGKEISLVFQDPLSSLNPVYDIFWHFNEVFNAHGIDSPRKERIGIVVDLLRTVGIAEPEKKLHFYPHQFSGGMRQRVVIALALLLHPKLIIADEPTTALDVTTQRAIFDLLKSLREKLGVSIIVISHDLYLIAEQCDRIYVMYSGEIMESGRAEDLFGAPLHPYSIGLMNSIPSVESNQEELRVIQGELANAFDKDLPGCCFADRCSLADEKCTRGKPPLVSRGSRQVKCLKV